MAHELRCQSVILKSVLQDVSSCDLLLPSRSPSPELIEAIPIIISLIVVEGLLGIDNALAIAATASHLPGKQSIRHSSGASSVPICSEAYVWLYAAWIIENPWLKSAALLTWFT
ncbi:MAG: hypothetical protein IPK32_16805 [Verrucomicrobiaceae bacterium]|nr:hypothetical protein [Verrucomicrobiaceae bacterium]